MLQLAPASAPLMTPTTEFGVSLRSQERYAAASIVQAGDGDLFPSNGRGWRLVHVADQWVVQRRELSLCAASRVSFRQRPLVILPPEGGLESLGGTHEKDSVLYMSLSSSLGFTLQDHNRVMEQPRFLLLTRSTSVLGCASRIETGVRIIAECTSYTPCILLSFSLQN